MRKARVLLVVTSIVLLAGCGGERREALRLARTLKYQHAYLLDNCNEIGNTLVQTRDWALHSADFGSASIQSAGFMHQSIADCAVAVGLAKDSLDALQLRFAFPQTVRSSVSVDRLDPQRRTLESLEALMSGALDGFQHATVYQIPSQVGSVRALLLPIPQTEDGIPEAIRRLREKYGFTDEEMFLNRPGFTEDVMPERQAKVDESQHPTVNPAGGDSPEQQRRACTAAGGVASRVTWQGGDWTIDLPPVMTTALAASTPGFSPYHTDWFTPEVRARFTELYPAAGRGCTSPSAVFADFNGDGFVDAALLGAKGDTQALIALLSNQTGYRVEELQVGSTLVSKGEMTNFLLVAAAGTPLPDAPGAPPRLAMPGVVFNGGTWGPDYFYVHDGAWLSALSPGD
jgi:hypothetical protein